MDQDHLLTELYAISNVPSVVWIDENNMIARPAAAEFGTDTFTAVSYTHLTLPTKAKV